MQVLYLILLLFLQQAFNMIEKEDSQNTRYVRLNNQLQFEIQNQQMQKNYELLQKELVQQQIKLQNASDRKKELQKQLLDINISIQKQEAESMQIQNQLLQSQSQKQTVEIDNQGLLKIKNQLYDTFQNLLQNKTSEKILNLKQQVYNQEIENNELENTVVRHRAYFENHQLQISQSMQDLIPLRQQNSQLTNRLLEIRKENSKIRAFAPDVESARQRFKEFFYDNFGMEIEMRPVRLENRKKWIKQEKLKIKQEKQKQEEVQSEIDILKNQFQELEVLKDNIKTEKKLNVQLRKQQIEAMLEQRILMQKKIENNQHQTEDLDLFIQKLKDSLLCINQDKNQLTNIFQQFNRVIMLLFRSFLKCYLSTQIFIMLYGMFIQIWTQHQNTLLSEYDQQSYGALQKLFLRFFIFYDGHYYWEIAKNGYSYESIHAFFPGFSAMLKFLSQCIQNLTNINFDLCLILSHVFLNIIFNFLNFVLLSKLANLITKKEKISRITALLYIFNPHIYFYRTLYTETYFLFFQTLGLYVLLKPICKNDNLRFFDCIIPTLIFTLGGLIRSNSFFSIGYILYFYFIYNHKWNLNNTITYAIKMLPLIIISIFPFLFIMNISRKFLCNSEQDNKYSEFCQQQKLNIYSYIQKRYWKVFPFSLGENGRLKSLIPLIIPPVMILILFLYKHFDKTNYKKFFVFLKHRKPVDKLDLLIPSIILYILLIILGIVMIHFNSLSRIISGYPFFYILLALGYNKSCKILKIFIRFWIIFYALVTIGLGANYFYVI